MIRKLQNFLFGRMPNPADATVFYNGAGQFTAPIGTGRRQIVFIIDGAGSVITTGLKDYVRVPVAGTFKKWTILSIDSAGPATAGAIVLDVWKDTFANYPPTVADTITAAAKPTVAASANKAESSTLTGWTTTFLAGDAFAVNVDSVSTFTKVALYLEYE
jgi:hypothetical protein